MYKSFTEMSVWQKANELSIDIFHLTKVLPRSEDYGLTSQIRRSANSVSANIAEGFGRKSDKDKIHFYIMARGSAFETQSHLIYGQKVGYFNEVEVSSIGFQFDALLFELNKIMKALSSQPQS